MKINLILKNYNFLIKETHFDQKSDSVGISKVTFKKVTTKAKYGMK